MCDHDHNHGGGACSHGDNAQENSLGYSLYQKINTQDVECLNERIDGSGVKVFKAWSDRFNENIVESDCDAELIFNIPFTGDVKLKAIVIMASEELDKIRLYKSNRNLSFEDVEAKADQEFQVTHDPQGTHEYPVKATKFFNVHHLTIHLVNRRKDDDTNPCRISYIGLKGEFTPVNRDAIVIANYEIRPNEGLPEELKSNSHQIQ